MRRPAVLAELAWQRWQVRVDDEATSRRSIYMLLSRYPHEIYHAQNDAGGRPGRH
jgi:hypothetical protein